MLAINKEKSTNVDRISFFNDREKNLPFTDNRNSIPLQARKKSMQFMPKNLWKLQKKNEEGFTLMEILVVIVITGVLSAIAVPVFLNQRKNAVDDLLKTDLQSIINVADSVRANNPNARFIVYKNNKVCAGATSAPTSCSATSPTVHTDSGGVFVISNGRSGPSGGAYYASAWHPDANKYNTQATRLQYASDEKKFRDMP